MAEEGEEDLYGVFGTEFTALQDEQKESVGRKGAIRPEDQIVTDEQGRRRFHGAFTGGFSAGYFMSVGSKEGWQPREFKSSRVQRAAQQLQTPEDYMDKDDLGEYGIASQTVQTTRDFDDASRSRDQCNTTKHKLAWEHATPEADALADLIKPVSDSFGVKLLKRMGWRQGMGVGLEAGAERSLVSQQGVSVDLGTDDIDMHAFVDKQDTKGLGYRGLEHTQVLSEGAHKIQKALKTNAKQKLGVRGQAFGVGAFEEDDEDIYSVEDISKYDYSLNNANKQKEIDVLSEEFVPSTSGTQSIRQFYAPPKLPRDYHPKRIHGKPKTGNKEGGDDTKDTVMAYLKEADRRRLARVRMQTAERRDEQDRQSTSSSRRHPNEGITVKQEPSTSTSSHRSSDRSDGRRSREDRDERSSRSSSRWNDDRPVKSEPKTPAYTTKEKPTVKREAVDESEWDIKKVYPDDAAKQKRFVQFMSYVSRGLSYPQPVDQAEWDWEAEVRQFKAKLPASIRESLDLQTNERNAAAPLAGDNLARPFAHLLKQRFTSSNRADDDDGRSDTVADDRMEAVKMNQFGALTRTKLEWHPSKILCKRFNVPDPYPNLDMPGCPALNARKEVDKRAKDDLMFVSGALMDTQQEMQNKRMMEQRGGFISRAVRRDSPSPDRSPSPAASTSRGRPSRFDRNYDASRHKDDVKREPKHEPSDAIKTEKEKPVDTVDLAIVERPEMHLFKSIFGDDDDSSSDDDSVTSEEADKAATPPPLAKPSDTSDAPPLDVSQRFGSFKVKTEETEMTIDDTSTVDECPSKPKLHIPDPAHGPVIRKLISLADLDDDDEDEDLQPLQLTLSNAPRPVVKSEPVVTSSDAVKPAHAAATSNDKNNPDEPMKPDRHRRRRPKSAVSRETASESDSEAAIDGGKVDDTVTVKHESDNKPPQSRTSNFTDDSVMAPEEPGAGSAIPSSNDVVMEDEFGPALPPSMDHDVNVKHSEELLVLSSDNEVPSAKHRRRRSHKSSKEKKTSRSISRSHHENSPIELSSDDEGGKSESKSDRKHKHKKHSSSKKKHKKHKSKH